MKISLIRYDTAVCRFGFEGMSLVIRPRESSEGLG